MKIKNGDFIEFDFVGRIKSTNDIFDLTIKEVSKKEGLHREGMQYKPLVACVGKGDILKGLDEFLVDKETGKEYDVEVPPEKGYGKRDNKLMQLVPINKFREQNINPFPGLQVTINNIPGIIKTVSGGRVIVDFNHPLSGRDLIYSIKIISIVTDEKKKVNGVLRNYFGFEDEKVEVEKETVTLHKKVNENIKEKIRQKLKEAMPSLKEVKFEKEEPKTENKPKIEKKE